MNCNAKNINAIVEKTRALLKNHRIASDIVRNNPAQIESIVNEKGVAKIKSIKFTDYREKYVRVYAGGIYVSATDEHIFSTDCWDEFMAIDDSNVFTKDMLETGMLVTTACGKTYIVMRDTRIHESKYGNFKQKMEGVLIEIGGWGYDFIRLGDYREDMKTKYCDAERQKENIVKVSLPINFGFNMTLEEIGEEVIWQRTT